MKKIISFFAVAVLLSLCVSADIPRVVNIRKSFTLAGVSDSIHMETNESNSGVRYHMLSWVTSGGALSACFVSLEKSVDNSTWTDLIAKVPCATASSTVVVAGLAPYLRVNVSTLTVDTGTPMLRVVYGGYQDDPYLGVSSPPTSTSTSTSTSSTSTSSTSTSTSTSSTVESTTTTL